MRDGDTHHEGRQHRSPGRCSCDNARDIRLWPRSLAAPAVDGLACRQSRMDGISLHPISERLRDRQGGGADMPWRRNLGGAGCPNAAAQPRPDPGQPRSSHDQLYPGAVGTRILRAERREIDLRHSQSRVSGAHLCSANPASASFPACRSLGSSLAAARRAQNRQHMTLAIFIRCTLLHAVARAELRESLVGNPTQDLADDPSAISPELPVSVDIGKERANSVESNEMICPFQKESIPLRTRAAINRSL